MQSSANRITAALSLPHQRKNEQTKLITNLTLYEAYTNHWTHLRREETKREKEFNLEAMEKADLKNNALKKINISNNKGREIPHK